MNLDLYTLAAFCVGVLAGVVVGFWLARFITQLTVERLEKKVQSLSDNKFELTGQRIRLKQLEQRLDAEAANIPLAEAELKEKTGEIRELTTALNETTALTADLSTALRARRAKVQQLQLEQSKWLKRNKALLLKSESTEKEIADLTAQKNNAKDNAKDSVKNNAPAAENNSQNSGPSIAAAPALAAGHHTGSDSADGDLDGLTNRMQQMETELKNWFDRIGKLEANATGQVNQATGLALLEEVLRGEAKSQDAAAKDSSDRDDSNGFLGNQSAS